MRVPSTIEVEFIGTPENVEVGQVPWWDIQARCRVAIGKIRTAITDNRIKRDAKQLAALERELASIEADFESNALDMTSILPPPVFAERWKGFVKRASQEYFPYLNMNSIQYTAKPRLFEDHIHTSIVFSCFASRLPMKHPDMEDLLENPGCSNDACLFDSATDPLLDYGFVVEARDDCLRRKHNRIPALDTLEVPSIFGEMRKSSARDAWEEISIDLFRDYVRMRCPLPFRFDARGRGTRIRMPEPPGVSAVEVRTFTLLQRLALMLFWIVDPQSIAKADHSTFDYLQLARKLEKVKLNDRSVGATPDISIGPASGSMPTSTPPGWKGWTATRRGTLGLTKKKVQFLYADQVDNSQCDLVSNWIKSYITDAGEAKNVHIMLGSVDGGAFRCIHRQLSERSDPRNHWILRGHIALLTAGASTPGFDEKVWDEIGVSPPAASDNLFLNVASNLSLADPELGRLWLARQNLEHLERSDFPDDLERRVPKAIVKRIGELNPGLIIGVHEDDFTEPPGEEVRAKVRVKCPQGHTFEVLAAFEGMVRKCPECETATPIKFEQSEVYNEPPAEEQLLTMVKATCPAGHEFELQQTFSGMLRKCPECGETTQIP